MNTLNLIRPDDWHCHLRDGAHLERTVTDTAQRFARAVVMPNLDPPISSQAEAQAYRERILKQIPEDCDFTPLMTLYLRDTLSPETLRNAAHDAQFIGAKLYPAGVTTHSEAGIKNIRNIYPLLEIMQECDFPLLVHGESSDPKVDIFDREAVFIEHELAPLIKEFPSLRIVLEHISTRTAVDFVRESSSKLAATITPQHLLFNRNDLLSGGIRPHYYCLPILKRHSDQERLIQAAISGNSKFFLGTDSAPHAVHKKQSSCGCAGIYSAHAAIELYAEIFEQNNALDKLEKFSSVFGAEFYQLPVNTQPIELHKKPWKVPAELVFGTEKLVPLYAHQILNWQIKGLSYPSSE